MKGPSNATVKRVTVKDAVAIQPAPDPECIAEMPTMAKMADRIAMAGIGDVRRGIPSDG